MSIQPLFLLSRLSFEKDRTPSYRDRDEIFSSTLKWLSCLKKGIA